MPRISQSKAPRKAIRNSVNTCPVTPLWRSAWCSFALSQNIAPLQPFLCENRSASHYDFVVAGKVSKRKRYGKEWERYGVKIALIRRKSDHVRQFSTSLSAYLANICPFHSPVMVRKHFLSGDLH